MLNAAIPLKEWKGIPVQHCGECERRGKGRATDDNRCPHGQGHLLCGLYVPGGLEICE